MSQQVYGLNSLSDLPELKLRAQQVLEGLEKGLIQIYLRFSARKDFLSALRSAFAAGSFLVGNAHFRK